MPDASKTQPTYTTDFVKSDHDKAVYLDSPHIDNLMAAFVGLSNEMWVMRRHILVLESVLHDNHLLDPAALDAYVPKPEQKLAWAGERDDFINRIFSVLTRGGEKVPTDMPTATVPPRG